MFAGVGGPLPRTGRRDLRMVIGGALNKFILCPAIKTRETKCSVSRVN
jgi:hypothetical protein